MRFYCRTINLRAHGCAILGFTVSHMVLSVFPPRLIISTIPYGAAQAAAGSTRCKGRKGGVAAVAKGRLPRVCAEGCRTQRVGPRSRERHGARIVWGRGCYLGAYHVGAWVPAQLLLTSSLTSSLELIDSQLDHCAQLNSLRLN